MNVIGFAGKYYTLWDCYTETTTNEKGVRFIHEHHQYIKNISFDLDKARAKYPDAPVDENLRGVTRSWTDTRVEYPDNVFAFGRYRGNLFTEIHDYDYMSWYFTQTHIGAQECLKPILEANGYYIYMCGESYDIITEVEHQKQLNLAEIQAQKAREYAEQLANGTLEFTPTRNLDDCGDWWDTETDFIFRFDEVREYYYEGYPYYLPVLKGKAKRIKNQRVHVLDGEIKRNRVLIHNFEILK